MPLPTVKTFPYELLARWMPEGDGARFMGAHVRWLTVIDHGDGKQQHIESDAEPIDAGQGKGFPLADVVDEMQVSALVRCDDLTQQVAKLEAEAKESTKSLAEVRAAAERSAEEVLELRAGRQAQAEAYDALSVIAEARSVEIAQRDARIAALEADMTAQME